jgi:Na+-transporting NADH:ubiquinone oxidoreductase subunit D
MQAIKETLTGPIFKNNPIALQILGVCSALAVTSSMKVTLVMCVALTLVTAFSGMFISVIRAHIPSSIRIIVQMVIIASLVILVDEVLRAFVYDVSKQLSVFVGLIITNCIIMGRLEAFAMANKPWDSFLDGLGNSFGYAWILIVVAFFRELLGSGTVWGYPVIEKIGLYDIGYENNGLMILSPMALIVVGIIIWIQRSKNKDLIESN